VSKSLRGPWVFQGVVLGNNTFGTWDADTTNPSAFPMKNNTVILMYRGCPVECNSSEQIGFASAETWKGPYVRQSNKPIFSNQVEDPNLWQDARGNWHVLMHSIADEGPNLGRHAYSRDGIVWIFGTRTVAYNSTVIFQNGKVVEFARRERPQVFFDELGRMLALVTGVQEKGSSGSFTLIQPIGR